MLPNECIFQQLSHNDEILSNLIVNVLCNISKYKIEHKTK